MDGNELFAYNKNGPLTSTVSSVLLGLVRFRIRNLQSKIVPPSGRQQRCRFRVKDSQQVVVRWDIDHHTSVANRLSPRDGSPALNT